MSSRRRDRDNSPWTSRRSRSRSYSPGRRTRPRNDYRKRSRSREKYSKKESPSSYRSDYSASKTIARAPPPPAAPVANPIVPPTYNPTVSTDFKNYANYNQYGTVHQDFSQQPIPTQYSIAYPPPPSWNSAAEISQNLVAGVPPPWPVAPPNIPENQVLKQPQESITSNEQLTDNLNREIVVAQEIQSQREELKKQRSDYLRKSDTLKKELKMLKEQMVELIGRGDAPPSPTTKGYIDENEKLQGQIQKKINTIENVLDMLTGIIGTEEKKVASNEKRKSESSDSSGSSSSSSSSSDSDDDSSPERLKTKVIESMRSRKEQKNEEKKKEVMQHRAAVSDKFNFVFYDPEMNWCKICNVFPKSAKDYLNHLHSKEHMDKIDTPPTPWHDNFQNDEFPHLPNVTIKRVPIRGLQFFVPSRAWFCKLCNIWMGDLHCASSHLKSRTHSKNYDEFFQKNLTYEVDWMAERQKALDNLNKLGSSISKNTGQVEPIFENIPLKLGNLKSSNGDKSKKIDSKKQKSKKKRTKKHKKGSSSSGSSSSSESDSKNADDRSTSIRVAMRNINKKQEDAPVESNSNSTEVDENEKKKDELIMTQWNTPQPIISESEKKLLEQLKGKLKSANKPSEPEAVKKESSESKKSSNREHVRKRSPSAKESPVTKRANRSRSRDRYRNRFDRRSRSPIRYNRRSRSRDRVRRSRERDRIRRSRSRDRNRRSRSRRGRSPYWRSSRRSTSRERRRWSTSKSKSRSRSQSTGSRRSARVEKPLVRYPEFRPRIPETETKRRSEREKKMSQDDDPERKKSPSSSSKKSSASTNSSYAAGGKKLPFIGRMPVLAKKQQEQLNENSNTDIDDVNQKLMEGQYAQYDPDAMFYDDLMPDPMQYATLMGAPPPPPPPMHMADDKEILPPGIDETESEFVPKPISEGPALRKGPLPKDFEEALNIIFPHGNQSEEKTITDSTGNQQVDTSYELTSETVSNVDTETNKIMEEIVVPARESVEQEHLQKMEITSSTVEETKTEVKAVISEAHSLDSKTSPEPVFKGFDITAEIQLPSVNSNTDQIPMPQADSNKISENLISSQKKNDDSPSAPISSLKSKEWRPQELDDLAMLGIDADDLAAQCI